MDVDELSRKYTNDTARKYDEKRENSEKWRIQQEAVASIISSLPASTRVLDIPMGTGRFIPVYQSCGLQVTGMDASEDMLDQARAKVNGADLNITFMKSDIFNIDAEDGSYDCVLSIRFLNWIDLPHLKLALSELARVSRKFVIVDIRQYVPREELRVPSMRFARQMLKRMAKRDNIVFHEKASVQGAFSEAGLSVETDQRLQERRDGTDYHVYTLVKAAGAIPGQ